MIDSILKGWKILKTALKLKKIAEGPAAQSVALSERVDQLMAEYQNNVSSARSDAIKKEISEIKGKLEKLTTVNFQPGAVSSASDAAQKIAQLELDLMASNFARQEYFRIVWAQSEKQLPQDDLNPKQAWHKQRAVLLRMDPLYINLATQMTGLAQKEQLAINQAYGNQKAVLEAIEEVRRQMPADTVDQMGMLALDTVHAMDETFLAIVRKLRYEMIAKWARKKTQDSASHIHFMDQIFAK